MTDVIIAVIPAPGHEGLVAEGPMGERPALLYATGTTPAWSFVGPFETPRGVLLRALQATVNATRIQRGLLWSDLPFDRSCVARVGRIYEWLGAPRALVLHAPGGPRLGMVRAMDVLDLAYVVTGKTREGSRVVVIGWRNGGAEEVNEVPEKWPDGMPRVADEAFAAAHLAVQRGLASEVLVLPVATPAAAG